MTAHHSNAISSYNKIKPITIQHIPAHCFKSEETIFYFCTIRYDIYLLLLVFHPVAVLLFYRSYNV